ncbi:MAG TPA: hypothetical protein DCZ71_04105 [Ruminococcus sp.]|nr:hypothetical protein [Ruminococcus sp.]
MSKKILLADTFFGSGRHYASLLSAIGYQTDVCSNTLSDITNKLHSGSFSAVMIHIMKLSDESINFIKLIRRDFPALTIAALVYDFPERTVNVFTEAGADKVIAAPCTDYEICCIVTKIVPSDDSFLFMPETGCFLISNNFPTDFDGFGYLCCAIETVITDPSAMQSVTSALYVSIAKTMNTSAVLVERSLRHYIRQCYECGILNELFRISPERLPTNTEVIAAAADRLICKIQLFSTVTVMVRS